MWRRSFSMLVVFGLALLGLVGIGPVPADAAAAEPTGGILIQACGTYFVPPGDCELNAADASHLGTHAVGNPSFSPYEMRRSPVSNRVAAVGYSAGVDKVVVFDADSTLVRSVEATPGAGLERALSWDPAGSRVVYAEQDGTEARLMLLDVTSGSTTELGAWPSTTTEEAVHSIDWSPDGATIALSGGHDSETPVGLWTADVATGVVTQRVSHLVGGVRWSPDGEQIGYAACRLPGASAVHELRVQDAAFASAPGVLQSYTAPDESCLPLSSGWDDPVNNEVAWHPDGDRVVAWSRDPSTGARLRVIDMTGSVLAETETEAYTAAGLAWAPDGSGVLYVDVIAMSIWSGSLSLTLHVLPADLSADEGILVAALVDGMFLNARAVWARGESLQPYAIPDPYRVSPGRTLSVASPGVLGNDLTYGTPTTASLTSGPAGLALGANGALSYAAPPTEGTHAFDYGLTSPGGASSATGTVHVDAPPPLDLTVTECPGAFRSEPPYDPSCDITVRDLQAETSTGLFTGPALPTSWNADHTRVVTGEPSGEDPEAEDWGLVVRDASMAETWRTEFRAPLDLWSELWSAGGEYLAYPDTSAESMLEVHTVRFDGTGDQIVVSQPLPSPEESVELRWSPQDDDRLFVRIGSTIRVYDGSSLTAELSLEEYDLDDFVPSPVDADVFAYTRHVAIDQVPRLQVRLRDISTGSDIPLADFESVGLPSNTAWSPDGGTIALFAVEVDDPSLGIWLVDVDAATKTLWRELAGMYLDLYPLQLEFSPDGSSLGWVEVRGLYEGLDLTSTLRVQELDAAVPITLVEDAPGGVFFSWGAPADSPATPDHVKLTVSGGGMGYAADADLTAGNLRVVKNSSGVASVAGAGTFPGRNAASASMSVSLNRLWILPLWLGNVRVNDGAYHFDGLMLFPSVSPTQTGASVNGSWLQLTSFPWGMGSLNLTVADRS
ncbi:MAG: hypothetical protein IT198_10780 [Acidimicrobiia bacterium]|nr:hypothetical protein [Acidimicrobiia bacterium]